MKTEKKRAEKSDIGKRKVKHETRNNLLHHWHRSRKSAMEGFLERMKY